MKSQRLAVLVWALGVGWARSRRPRTSAPQPASNQEKRTLVIEEIVVTARRREELSQSVPVSITAYSAEDVKAHNITDQLSLANNTPSLVAISSGVPREFGGFAIRGQGPAFGATPGTIGYFSDVPNGVITIDGRPGTYFDLASVQVLKGRKVHCLERMRPAATYCSSRRNDRSARGLRPVAGRKLLRSRV